MQKIELLARSGAYLEEQHMMSGKSLLMLGLELTPDHNVVSTAFDLLRLGENVNYIQSQQNALSIALEHIKGEEHLFLTVKMVSLLFFFALIFSFSFSFLFL